MENKIIQVFQAPEELFTVWYKEEDDRADGLEYAILKVKLLGLTENGEIVAITSQGGYYSGEDETRNQYCGYYNMREIERDYGKVSIWQD